MAADRAFDPGETEMQVAAIQVFIDHIHDIWPPVAVSAFVAVIPGHFQLLEIRFDASLLLVVLGLLNGKFWLPGKILSWGFEIGYKTPFSCLFF